MGTASGLPISNGNEVIYMILKHYLPFRFSREGCFPDRIVLRPCKKNGEGCERELTELQKAAHYHIDKSGCITALAPLSCASNLLGPTGTDPTPAGNDLPLGRRGILILTEGESLCQMQKEPLIRLLKRIQKEVFRIYGSSLPFSRRALLCDPSVYPVEELLEEGYVPPETNLRFRVQTGCYSLRKEAEERVMRLASAGIAAYITEVRET